jgi:hypothetical protein
MHGFANDLIMKRKATVIFTDEDGEDSPRKNGRR